MLQYNIYMILYNIILYNICEIYYKINIFGFFFHTEGEEEAEWLRTAGLEQLTEAWKAGREVQPEELGAALRPLSRIQAEAVKRRVRSLNHTVKQRFNQRQRVRKPDIRDVFKDVEVYLYYILYYIYKTYLQKIYLEQSMKILNN